MKLFVLLIFLAIYFLPAIVASNRRHQSEDAIFLLNLLLGWTLLGWVVAFIWSLTNQTQVVVNNQTPKSAVDADASNFAKQHAQEIGATVKLEREGDHWAVFTGQGDAPPTPSDQNRHSSPPYNRQQYSQESSWWERHLEEQCKREEQEQKRRELEQKAREAEIREREKRRPYLNERENYYRSLPESELEKHWKRREEMDLDPDEVALLREIVREVKGIKPAYGHSAKVCRQCGMVGENCTCGRSWF